MKGIAFPTDDESISKMVIGHPLFVQVRECLDAINLAKRADVTMLDVTQLANVVQVMDTQYRDIVAHMLGQIIGMELAYTEVLQNLYKKVKEIEG